LVNFRD